MKRNSKFSRKVSKTKDSQVAVTTPVNTPAAMQQQQVQHHQFAGQPTVLMGVAPVPALQQIGIQWQINHQPSTSLSELHNAAIHGFDQVRMLSRQAKTDLNTIDNELMAYTNEVEQQIQDLNNRLSCTTMNVACDTTSAVVENPINATSAVLENTEDTVKKVAAMEDHLTSLGKHLAHLKSVSSKNASVTVSLMSIGNACDGIQEHLRALMNVHKSMENIIQRLEREGHADRKRIEELQGQLDEQKKEVVAIREAIGGYQLELEQSNKVNSSLAAEVEQLRGKIDDLEQRLSKRDAEAAISEEDQAVLVLRQLLSQVTTMMFKRLFPKSFSSKRTYTYRSITIELNKLKKGANTALYQQKLKEKDALVQALGWEDDMEDQVEEIKRNTGANGIAHPDLVSVNNIKSKIDLLHENEILNDEEVEVSNKLAEMWRKLSTDP